MSAIDAILQEIARLSSRERALLWQRARAMGLLDAEAEGEAAPARIQMTLVFDGGSRGNPGPGYGSYALLWPERPPEVHRLHLGERMTNNEAEYDTLIAALEALLGRLDREGIDPRRVDLEVRSDSQLVVNQVTGAWRAREPRLQARCQRVRALLEAFGSAEMRHQPRERSVALLGH